MPSEKVPIRVLVVDDERIVADSLALVLRDKGFDTRTAYSGEEAVDLALAWKPDAVITDVVMEKMDGIALAVYLAQILPSCKLLLMSGNIATEQLLDDAKKQGHDFPILAKPFHPSSIFDFLFDAGTAGSAL